MGWHLNTPITAADWAGLRVWLIGASTGIGASLAVALAAHGARLVLSARQQAALEEVAAQCAGQSGAASPLVIPLDICDRSAVEAALGTLKAAWDGVDLVIFNAGTYEPTRVDELEPGRATRSLGVNLLAPIEATALLLPHLLAARADGRPRGLAYVASVAGYRGLPRALTYGPGKAGLISFAESLWIDLHGVGLNTWVINPGFVRTRLTAQNSFEMPALIEPEDAARAIIDGFARGRFEIHFPRRFTYVMKLLRVLPIGGYLRLAQSLVPSLRRDQGKG